MAKISKCPKRIMKFKSQSLALEFVKRMKNKDNVLSFSKYSSSAAFMLENKYKELYFIEVQWGFYNRLN